MLTNNKVADSKLINYSFDNSTADWIDITINKNVEKPLKKSVYIERTRFPIFIYFKITSLIQTETLGLN